jgi:hypothetical protein
MRWLDPIPVHLWGAHIDRDTVEGMRDPGFVVTQERNLMLDVVKHIEATAPLQRVKELEQDGAERPCLVPPPPSS